MKKLSGVLITLALALSFACHSSNQTSESDLFGEVNAFPEAVSYDLKFDLDFDQTSLEAECVLAVKNPGDEPLRIVPLNLYRLITVSSVTDSSGKQLDFGQRTLIYDDWKEFQVNHVRVALDPALAPGETEAIRILYGGPFLGYSEAMRYVKDHVSREFTLLRTDSMVFPRIGVPSWETNRGLGLGSSTYRASVTVPAPLIVANGGDLVSKETAGEETTYIYRSRLPSWRIDLAAAEYETLEDSEGRFKLFFFPDDHDGAQALLERLIETMDLYTKWLGPLKVFKGLTVIEVPDGYGSQADVAAIIQEASAFKDPANYYTFYHELSHLWNVEGKDPMPPRFESEGQAMFLQHLVQERLEGRRDAAKNAVKESLVRMAKHFSENPERKSVPMIDYGKEQLTDLSYRMGQIFFYLLYEILGEEAFLEAAGGFYRTYFVTGAEAREFVEYFRSRSPADLEKLFEEWIFTAKAAELVVSRIPLEELLKRYR
jgi:aminopeptidase N